jgi:hypothetical protein
VLFGQSSNTGTGASFTNNTVAGVFNTGIGVIGMLNATGLGHTQAHRPPRPVHARLPRRGDRRSAVPA